MAAKKRRGAHDEMSPRAVAFFNTFAAAVEAQGEAALAELFDRRDFAAELELHELEAQGEGAVDKVPADLPDDWRLRVEERARSNGRPLTYVVAAASAVGERGTCGSH